MRWKPLWRIMRIAKRNRGFLFGTAQFWLKHSKDDCRYYPDNANMWPGWKNQTCETDIFLDLNRGTQPLITYFERVNNVNVNVVLKKGEHLLMIWRGIGGLFRAGVPVYQY